jgi:hypothetical protein
LLRFVCVDVVGVVGYRCGVKNYDVRPPTEAQEMRMLAQYLDARGLLWLHPPNEGRRSARMGAELKRQGLKPGAPDVLIFDNPPSAIELKRSIGARLAPAQLLWLNQLRDRGWRVECCHGAQDAIGKVEEWYPTRKSAGDSEGLVRV